MNRAEIDREYADRLAALQAEYQQRLGQLHDDDPIVDLPRTRPATRRPAEDGIAHAILAALAHGEPCQDDDIPLAQLDD